MKFPIHNTHMLSVYVMTLDLNLSTYVRSSLWRITHENTHGLSYGIFSVAAQYLKCVIFLLKIWYLWSMRLLICKNHMFSNIIALKFLNSCQYFDITIGLHNIPCQFPLSDEEKCDVINHRYFLHTNTQRCSSLITNRQSSSVSRRGSSWFLSTVLWENWDLSWSFIGHWKISVIFQLLTSTSAFAIFSWLKWYFERCKL